LTRLFINLLDNAIKYTPENGRIIVTAETTNDQAKIAVSDSGIGIPDGEIEHVFDRFYRVDKSRHTAGSGLGLSIARSIAEAHRGSIEIKSVLKRGTTVTVCLPVYRS
jgi:signal transduction histidine kinase